MTGDTKIIQLEKLLQKNYFLHQSAKDGYRAYLQAYASYSLKKIFDVNKLDLAKVGKAFGFAVPPRVNISIGGGKGGAGRSGIKRKREDDEDGEDDEDEVISREKAPASREREKEKERRIERLGKRKVEKEVYRKGGIAKKTRWSR
jgi:ATP-dependent RNA helicase DDX18/HAS1